MPPKAIRAIAFSEKSIQAIELPESGRVDWWDKLTPELQIRVSQTGNKTFYWSGRERGRPKRIKIGTWPKVGVKAARIAAKNYAASAAAGRAVMSLVKRTRSEWRLAELFGWYLETQSKPFKRTWKWDERNYITSLMHWEKRFVSDISTNEIQSLHLEIGERRGRYAGNKMLELLGAMYRKGNAIAPAGVPCPDPTRGIRRFPREERERFLDSEELPKFLEGVAKLKSERARDFLMLCLFTGGRRANVCAMRWDQLNLKSGVWTIPASESKNKKQMIVALSPPAVEILTRRKAKIKGPWVLPSQSPTGHFMNPKDAMLQACKHAGLKDVRVHDLRRTLGSWMAINSPLQVVGKQLGHSSFKSTQIYARLATKTLVDAVGDAAAAMQGKAKGDQ